ncbi:hypothetical protein TI05_00670 [Achromatium sp. WMS3]|nr:hypothetical protein TI05_00670 [Achromatium sp. WMS3]
MKPKSLFLFILIIFAGLVITLLVYQKLFKSKKNSTYSESLIPQPIQTYSKLPKFDLLDINGKLQASNQWEGKILILNFWATWCGPCLREIPEFIQLQEELHSQGLQFVGIAIDEHEKVRNFATKTKINYPILLGDDPQVLRLLARLGNRFGALPFSIIFAPDGVIIHRGVGELTVDTIRTKIAALIPTSK